MSSIPRSSVAGSVGPLAQRRLLRPSALISLALVVIAGMSLAACSRFRSGSLAARDDLALVPSETAALFMLNVKQARQSRIWQKLLEARNNDPPAKQAYDQFIAKCGFDPVQQIDSLFVAVPANSAENKEYAMLLRGTYDPKLVVQCAQRTASDAGEPLTESKYQDITLYAMQKPGPYLAVLGKRAVALGGQAWMHKVIDLHLGKLPVSASARDNRSLHTLLSRTRTGDSFFWAGQTSPQMLARLRQFTQLGAAAALQSSSGSVDIKGGLFVRAALDFQSAADANAITEAANQQLQSLKSDMRATLLGVSNYLNEVRFTSQGAQLHVEVHLTDQQIDDLITQVSTVAKSMGFGG